MAQDSRRPMQAWVGRARGFTLIELLLVVIFIGIMLAVILPRAKLAEREARFAMVRQHATEIGSYTVQWAQGHLMSKRDSAPQNIADILTEPTQGEDAKEAGFASRPLVGRYTGDPHFAEQVGRLVSTSHSPLNPFNQQSYFAGDNDDRDQEGVTVAPSSKPGLLYLVAVPEGEVKNAAGQPAVQSFYFIFTAQLLAETDPAAWYRDQGLEPEGARRGIFVYHSRN